MNSNNLALTVMEHALNTGDKAGAVTAFTNLDAATQQRFLTHVMARTLGRPR